MRVQPQFRCGEQCCEGQSESETGGGGKQLLPVSKNSQEVAPTFRNTSHVVKFSRCEDMRTHINTHGS